MKKKREILFIAIMFCISFLVFSINAEAIGIDIENKESDIFNFKVILYDDSKNIIDGQLSYLIQNFYTDIVQEGKINSGESINFKLPKNPYQGPWKISVNFNGIKTEELFNVGDIKRADMRLENDNLIIENTGNILYDKKILVSINEQDQTIQVYLNVGQTKIIRLTAPNGKYSVNIDDGENQLSQSGVSLTGNVIGAESVIKGNFWSKYPLVVLFLLSLFFIFIVISVLKLHNRMTNRVRKSKKRR